MSEQNTSKSVHEIPAALIDCFEIFYNQKIVKVELLRSYRDIEGLWKVFEVNEQFIFYVLNGRTGDITTLEKEEEKKKAFGERAKYVMKEANVSWELAKMAVSRNPVDSWKSESTANAWALHFIQDVKEALAKYRMFCKEKMSMEEYLKYHARYSLGRLTNKEIRIVKEYWLSLNA